MATGKGNVRTVIGVMLTTSVAHARMRGLEVMMTSGDGDGELLDHLHQTLAA